MAKIIDIQPLLDLMEAYAARYERQDALELYSRFEFDYSILCFEIAEQNEVDPEVVDDCFTFYMYMNQQHTNCPEAF